MIPNNFYELELYQKGYRFIAGVDEAGRGAWAGPLVAAAVILPIRDDGHIPRLYRVRDSKILLPDIRRQLIWKIRRLAAAWGIGIVEIEEFNQLGLARAGHLVLARAIENLDQQPDAALVDFYHIKYKFGFPLHQVAIKYGDAICQSIAAASILAKVERDRLMRRLHREDKTIRPFHFHKNFGYGCPVHRQKLKELGPTRYHRKNYRPVAQLKNFQLPISPDVPLQRESGSRHSA